MPRLPPFGLRLPPERETVTESSASLSPPNPSCLRRLGRFCCALLVSSLLVTGARAEGTAEQSSGVVVGITGHYRIGCWTTVRFDKSSADGIVAGGEGVLSLEGLSLETVDGDGTRTIYRQWPADAEPSPDRGSGRFGYCIPGGEAVPLVIRGGGGNEIRTRFPEFGSPAREASQVPPEMPWVLALGDPMGVETVGANELLGREAQVAVSMPQSPGELPDAVLGYDGVDLMLINDAGRDLLGGLDDDQASAVADWVDGGGQLLICLGESAPALLDAAPWLYRLLPIEPDELAMTRLQPSGFETYMLSGTPLASFAGVELPSTGRQLIRGRTTRRERATLAEEYLVGMGRVTVVAHDLHRPPMAEWPERLEMIVRLTGETLTQPESNAAVPSRATGFNDLAGQTRATLDQFETKRPFRFSIITLIVLGLVALIGPFDYWLINRVLRRPAFGWITFPAVIAVVSIWLVLQAKPRGIGGEGVDSTLGLNRLEIVDIDSIANQGRGFAWSYLYSHPARRVDVTVEAGGRLDSISERIGGMVTAPFGWPGAAFGGVQLAGEDVRMPAYTVELGRRVAGRDTAGSVRELPIAPRSSKSLSTQFHFRADLQEEVVVTRRRGSELLEGRLTNPLPFDLLDGMLVYRDWAYLLPTRFPAGARIDSLGNLRQKNFRWHLSRQRAIEESTEGEAWDPLNVDDPARIAEMLMFHQAAGGRRYTTLRHVPLSFLDLSPLLTEDRCMLVGRLAEPLTQLSVATVDGGEGGAGGSSVPDPSSAPGPSSASWPGQSVAMIRLILPVESANADR